MKRIARFLIFAALGSSFAVRSHAYAKWPAEKAAHSASAPKQSEPTASEKEEVAAAIRFFTEKTASANLAKLRNGFRDYDFTDREIDEFKDALPERFRDRLIIKTDKKLLETAVEVFGVHRLKNRRLLLYESEAPLAALWKGYYVLVSSQAVELLDDDETAGQIAHETAHLYFMDDLRRAREERDERAERIIELKADAAAIFALIEMKRNPAAVFRGLQKMISYLTEHRLIAPAASHPPLAARKRLLDSIMKMLRARGQ